MHEAAKAISFQDIRHQNRTDNFKLVAPVIQPGDTVLHGRYCAMALRSGLRFHATDIVDMHDLVTQAQAEPGLTIGLFLQGGASVSLGGKPFAFGEGGEFRPHAFALNCAETDLFERRGKRGRRVCKVNINLPPDWLERQELTADDLRPLFCGHRAVRTWSPSPRHLELAQGLLYPDPAMPFIHSLHQESLALEFVAETLRQWEQRPEPAQRLGGRDLARLRRACDYLDAHQDSRLHVDDVAREAGMSISGLQRLFHAAHGASVLEFARTRRLLRAREALEQGAISVTEAALNAGYTSSANFATAFKRQFGISPKDARRR